MGITDEILADIEAEETAQSQQGAPASTPAPVVRTTESITDEILADIESEDAVRQKTQRGETGESFLELASRPIAPADALVTGTQQLFRAPGAAFEAAQDPEVQDIAAETVGGLVGGIGGGIAGGVAGGPPGAFVAAPPGAAAGAMFASNQVTRLRGTEETPEEAQARRFKAATAGALGEFGGRALTALAPKVVKGLSSRATEIAKEFPIIGRILDPLGSKSAPVGVAGGAQALAELTAAGAPPTGGQLVASGAVQLAENIAEGAIFTNRTVLAREKAATKSLELWDDFVRQFSGALDSPTARGEVLQQTLEESGDIYKALLSSQWDAVDAAIAPQSFRVPGAPFVAEGATVNPVQMGPVKEALRKSFSGGGRDVIDPELKQLIEWVDAIPDQVPFGEAATNRSILLEIARSGQSNIMDEARKGGAKRGAKLIDDALTEAGKNLEGEAFDLWRAANASTRLGKERFNTKLMRKIIGSEDPAQAWQVVSRAKSSHAINKIREIIFDSTNIDEATGRAAIQDPEAFWRGVQGQWLSDATERATPSAGARFGEFDATKVLGKINQNTQTKEAFEAMFPDPAHRKRLLSLLRTREIAQTRTGAGGAGKVVMQLMQAGAVANVMFRRPVEGSAVRGLLGVVLTPMGLARALESPRLTKFLMEGATGELSGPRAARWFAQLATQLGKEKIPYFAEMNSGQGPEVFDVTPGQPAQKVGAQPAAGGLP